MDLHGFSMIFDDFRHRDIAGRSKCLHDSSSRSGRQMTSGDPSLGNPSPKMRFIYIIYMDLYMDLYVFFNGLEYGFTPPKMFWLPELGDHGHDVSGFALQHVDT